MACFAHVISAYPTHAKHHVYVASAGSKHVQLGVGQVQLRSLIVSVFSCNVSTNLLVFATATAAATGTAASVGTATATGTGSPTGTATAPGAGTATAAATADVTATGAATAAATATGTATAVAAACARALYQMLST